MPRGTRPSSKPAESLSTGAGPGTQRTMIVGWQPVGSALTLGKGVRAVSYREARGVKVKRFITPAGLLMSLGAVMALACGDGPAAPEPIVLDTSARSEPGGQFPSGVAITLLEWRLISSDSTGVRGSYTVDWMNNAAATAVVVFELRFFDAQGFELDRWPSLSTGRPQRVIATGGTGRDTGTFILDDIVSVEAANQITRMEVWAAIDIVDPLEILSPSPLPSGTVGTPYSVNLTAAGGLTPLTWQITSGTLPPGLQLFNSPWRVSGTPSAEGLSTVSFTVSSSDGQTDSRAFEMMVFARLGITTSSLPVGITDQPYDVSLEATGGDGTYTWTLASGQLPAGVSLSQDGRISGTPTTSGQFSFLYFRVTSGDGQTSARYLSIDVQDPLVILNTSPLPSGTVGRLYQLILNPAGGEYPYTWQITAGSLPGGLDLVGAPWRIYGTPTTAGIGGFTLEVSSGDGQTEAETFQITVYDQLVITTGSLPDGTVALPYNETLAAAGGDGSYAWSLASYSSPLPSGLSLTSDGTISGTPSEAGFAAISVEVRSGDGQTTARVLSIGVN